MKRGLQKTITDPQQKVILLTLVSLSTFSKVNSVGNVKKLLNLGVAYTMICSSNFFISLKFFIYFWGKNKVNPTSIPNPSFLAKYYLATGSPATTSHNRFRTI